MAKLKIRKAEAHEKANYRGVHGLFGYIEQVPAVFAGVKTRFTVPVEYLGEGRDEPNYEAIAPNGLHWEEGDGVGLHTMIGVTQKDLLDRVYELTECSEQC